MRARHHRCDAPDLDYGEVEEGIIRCTVCPRVWELVVRVDEEGRKWGRWLPSPCPGCDTSPCRCRRTAKPTLKGGRQ